MKDPHLLRAIIMDHYQYPRNQKQEHSISYVSKHMASSTCVDDITVQILWEEDKIADINFYGRGCTISTASTSVMTQLLKNKTIVEAKQLVENYMNMLQDLPYDEVLLQEAIAFSGVNKQANRIQCATIGWRAVLQLIKEKEE